MRAVQNFTLHLAKGGVVNYETCQAIQGQLIEFLWGSRYKLPPNVQDDIQRALCTVETVKPGSVVVEEC